MVYVQPLREDLACPTFEDAREQHGRPKLAITSEGSPVMDDGEYYLLISETCPTSGHKCRGGGCRFCEFVPPCRTPAPKGPNRWMGPSLARCPVRALDLPKEGLQWLT
jgi:hypothetical protein